MFWGGRLYVGILEAKAELGTLTDADLTKYMKPLWERAGIDTSKLTVAFLNGINDPKNKMGVSSLIYEIRRLRRCELMLDDGIRYWDPHAGISLTSSTSPLIPTSLRALTLQTLLPILQPVR